MSNENGTLLARQVRRFIEQNPAAKSLENVEDSAKAIILELGNPAYFADKSEEFEPFPPELRVKRTFESKYKKLQKEYTSLPDLKQKVSQDGENDKDDRGKKAKEDQEKRDQEKRDQEKRDQEKRDQEKRDQEKRDQEKRDQEKRDQEKRDQEKRDQENRDREKQDGQQMGQESSTSHLLDQLRSMDPEQLQGLLQDLHISSSTGSKETTPDTTSSRGTRETTADSSSSWNTRGASADPTTSASRYWKNVRGKFGEDTEYWLNKLSVTSQENDCDFSDVKFYLEYLLRQDSNRSVSDLGGLALDFVDNCPASQAELVKDLREKDPQLHRAYNTYHASSRISGEKKERRPWARNPQAYRDRIFEDLPPERDQEWNQITLSTDPDTGRKKVKGRITASIAGYLDVCLDSLLDNDEERHHLVPRTDYPTEAYRFENSERGKLLTIKPSAKETLSKREKSDIKILNCSSAYQTYPDTYPRMYFFGVDKKAKKKLNAWARSSYCWYNKFRGGLDDYNEQRKTCGQKEITTISRPHTRWPSDSRNSNSDSDSDFESDIELVSVA